MSSTDYGPVAQFSRVKAESGAIFDALARGRRVLIAKHDRVVAAIDPATAVPRGLLFDYVTPGAPSAGRADRNRNQPRLAVARRRRGKHRADLRDEGQPSVRPASRDHR